jgi:hypothetical protein
MDDETPNLQRRLVANKEGVAEIASWTDVYFGILTCKIKLICNTV